MRVLFATYGLAFQNPGGGERVLLSLERELRARGHEVTFFDPFLHDVRDYEIIHYFSTWENSFWTHAKRLAPRTPLIVTPAVFVSDKIASRARGFLSRLRRQALAGIEGRKDVFELPDFWLPSTLKEAETLRRAYGIAEGRILNLPNGVDERFAMGDAAHFRRKTGIDGPFVLHVGRFHPVKNQPLLMDALLESGARGVFIGDPDVNQRDYFAACVHRAEASGGKITILQGIAHEDPLLAGAYAACHLFALPSRFETFGIAALEAATAGAPLLLSRGMIAREIFDGNCRWADPERPEEWSKAIREAIVAGGDRANIDLEARAKLAGAHSWGGIAARLEAVYDRLVGSA